MRFRVATWIVGSTVLVSLLLAPAWVQGQSPIGTWELWSIDGLDPSEAVATQSAIDFDVAFGTDTLHGGDSWIEWRLLGSTLEALSDGDYRETKVTVSTTYMTAKAYRRLTGLPYFGDEALREVSTPDTSTIIGRWRSEDDSVVFFRTHGQVSESLVSAVAGVYPAIGTDSLRALMGPVVEEFHDPEWLGQQMRGDVVSRDRLVLEDGSGRVLVYRRRQGG